MVSDDVPFISGIELPRGKKNDKVRFQDGRYAYWIVHMGNDCWAVNSGSKNRPGANLLGVFVERNGRFRDEEDYASDGVEDWRALVTGYIG